MLQTHAEISLSSPVVATITEQFFIASFQTLWFRVKKIVFRCMLKWLSENLISGGDPTGTGRGGTSIYGDEFGDELHSDLRHSGAGVLSMVCVEIYLRRMIHESNFIIILGKLRTKHKWLTGTRKTVNKYFYFCLFRFTILCSFSSLWLHVNISMESIPFSDEFTPACQS